MKRKERNINIVYVSPISWQIYGKLNHETIIKHYLTKNKERKERK